MIFDKFGEEGLKAGVPTATGDFISGYTFHGDSTKVFRDFFGGDNPFSGEYIIRYILCTSSRFLSHVCMCSKGIAFGLSVCLLACPPFFGLLVLQGHHQRLKTIGR